MTLEHAKRAAGIAAADLIQNGMIVGLGTGTTAAYFIEALQHRVQSNLSLKAAIPSSKTSAELAKRAGLPVRNLNEFPHVDITVDGADEIDPLKRMIKGGGGAHVREKILASSSDEMIVIVDETKLVSLLGRANLPVEILSFGSPATRNKLEELGYRGEWRRNKKDHSLFITENDNLLFDIAFDAPLSHPEKIHETILHLPGVVDTGFFFHIAGRVIVGYENGLFDIR